MSLRFVNAAFNERHGIYNFSNGRIGWFSKELDQWFSKGQNFKFQVQDLDSFSQDLDCFQRKLVIVFKRLDLEILVLGLSGFNFQGFGFHVALFVHKYLSDNNRINLFWDKK